MTLPLLMRIQTIRLAGRFLLQGINDSLAATLSSIHSKRYVPLKTSPQRSQLPALEVWARHRLCLNWPTE